MLFAAGHIPGVSLTLVEQHRLALDAPIATLVPEVHFVNPWEKTHPVRLVNLLKHTTGWH